jgi:type II secretory pathway pseudopilin PulG
LVELLVSIGVIAVLLGILFTLVPRIQKAARRTQTQQHLNVLQHAVEQYYLDFRAYPGPFPDKELVTGTLTVDKVPGPNKPTMSENLVLGLLGGLVVRANRVEYAPDRIGAGALNLSASTASTAKPYVDMTAARSMLSASDAPFKDSIGRTALDTVIPEFIDQFHEPLPILYARARPGASGILSDATTPGAGKFYQYDLRQLTPYTSSQIGLAGAAAHGLRELGPDDPIPHAAVDAKVPAKGLQYFRQPQSDPNDPAVFKNLKNAEGTPRQRDRYVLISAGPDRVYGTADDITSFGDVNP